MGTIIELRLKPQERAEYPSKYGPFLMGPWVVVERFTNGKTCRVRDSGSKQELPSDAKNHRYAPCMEERSRVHASTLPRLGHVELREGMPVQQKTPMRTELENACVRMWVQIIPLNAKVRTLSKDLARKTIL